MAEVETIPAESEALERVLGAIDELGLNPNVVELETHGFTTVKAVLSEAQIERAKAAILARVEGTVGHAIDVDTATEDDLQGTTYIPYMLYDDEIFEEILVEPKPLALINYLLGESCLLSSMGCHFKGPGGIPLPLHSDNGNGIPAPFPATSHVANVNYALTPYSREAGALALVPGSHKLARQPRPAEADLGENANPDAIAMNIDPGDAVIWHGNSWHGLLRPRDSRRTHEPRGLLQPPIHPNPGAPRRHRPPGSPCPPRQRHPLPQPPRRQAAIRLAPRRPRLHQVRLHAPRPLRLTEAVRGRPRPHWVVRGRPRPHWVVRGRPRPQLGGARTSPSAIGYADLPVRIPP